MCPGEVLAGAGQQQFQAQQTDLERAIRRQQAQPCPVVAGGNGAGGLPRRVVQLQARQQLRIGRGQLAGLDRMLDLPG
ncbi:hypothetical protein D3C86_2005670 [compost metagenome]